MRFGGLIFDDFFDLASNLLRVLGASSLLTGVFMSCLMVCHYSGTELVRVADFLLMPGVLIAGMMRTGYFIANFLVYLVPFWFLVWRWHVRQVIERTGKNRASAL